ncbi:MAG TPA: TldD/PmbA family protein, partial [Mesotoga sp.]|nr:TldD/PmbA family protein [Mesotoga sp.]
MFDFPEYVYSDVRVEEVSNSNIVVTLGRTDNMKEQKYVAAFIRIFDGERWYFSSTTDLNSVQGEIYRLADLAKKNPSIEANQIVQKFQVNKGSFLRFEKSSDISTIPLKEKRDILSTYFPIVEESGLVRFWRGQYVDQRVVKSFFSSKGADLKFDYQRVGFRMLYQMADGEEQLMDRFDLAGNELESIKELSEDVRKSVEASEYFIRNAKSVIP